VLSKTFKEQAVCRPFDVTLVLEADMPYTPKILEVDNDALLVQMIPEMVVLKPALPNGCEVEAAFSGGEAKGRLVGECGFTLAEIARWLGVSTSAIAK
jgi:hypothetical protein